MSTRGRAFVWLLLLLAVQLVVGLLPPPASISRAQPQGATMTVLRGQVAVVRGDGSAIQPAQSGTTVFPGDEIRTVGTSDALITFFVGTEIEMGPDTALLVEQVSRDGSRIDVSLKQVFGVTLTRLQTFADPGSAYRIEAGGAVALIRGSTPAVVGPKAMQTGNLVGVGCGDCGPNDVLIVPGLGTFRLSPPVVYVFEVVKRNGRWVPVGPVIAFAFPPGVDPRNAVFDGLTSFDQSNFDTEDQSPGVFNPGVGFEPEEEDEDDDGPPAVITTTSTTPTTTRTTAAARTTTAATATTTAARPATTTTTATPSEQPTNICTTTTTVTETETETDIERVTTTTTRTVTRTVTISPPTSGSRGDDSLAYRSGEGLPSGAVFGSLLAGGTTTCETTRTRTFTSVTETTVTETRTRTTTTRETTTEFVIEVE